MRSLDFQPNLQRLILLKLVTGLAAQGKALPYAPGTNLEPRTLEDLKDKMSALEGIREGDTAGM